MVAFAIAAHLLATIIWIGGMFFAYVILRPSLGFLDPPQRLTIWANVFKRFFVWVWVIVFILPLTGYAQVIIDFGGFENVGMHITLMHMTGWAMIALFVYLFVGPYGSFQACVAAADWPAAAGHLNVIRRIVGTNTVLGIVTAAIGASGRFWE